MANWIQRFLTAIATHKGDAAAHHAKTTSFADITDRAGASKLNWTLNKLLKGAGAGADPTEIDVPTGVTPATYVVAAQDSLDPTRADAQCDGVDDDLDIETAIAALPAEGGRVVLLEGTYILGATLDIAKDYVTIEGNGPNTIIQGVTGFATITISATADHITHRNLQIKNTGTAATDYCVSIASGDPTYITFDHCWFEGGYRGIYIGDHCIPLFIEGCIFHGHVREAVRSASIVSGHMVNCHFDTLAYTGDEIVRLRDIIAGFVIAGCTLDTCARGMLLHGKLLVFSSNVIYQCTNGASLTIDAGSEGAIVIGNNIRGSTIMGIRVPGAASVNIVGNIILEPSITYGIILSGTNVGIQIIGNIIEDCTTGIRIWDTSSVGTIVRGNSFRNCTTPITDGGASSIIRDNEGYVGLGDIQVFRKIINYDDASPVAICAVEDGYAVTDVWVDVITTFDDGGATLNIGDGGDADGFLPTANINLGVAGYYGLEADERGDYLWDSVNSHIRQKAYTATDTVDATIGKTNGTQGVAEVYVRLIRIGA